MLNNIKKLKYLYLIALLTLSICCFGLFGFVLNDNVYAQEAILSSVSYQPSYLVGDEIELQSATIELDGKKVDADKSIIFPDGRKYSLDNVTLSQGGAYTIVYSSVINGNYVEKTIDIEVKSKLYEVVGEGSANYYESYSLRGIPSVDKHESNPNYSIDKVKEDDITGVLVSLNSGDIFKYNKILDLSDTGIYDSILKLNVIPSYIGKKDFTILYITLTDIYDENNFVRVVINASYSLDYERYNHTSLYQAGFNEQPTKGLNRFENKVYQSPHYGGLHTALSFSGLPYANRTIAEDNFSFSFDAQTNSIYVTNYHFNFLNYYGDKVDTSLVIDLDDPTYFPEPWAGFTTGEVYLSVEAGGYINSTATIAITDIYEEKDLSNQTLVDKEAPNLQVDLSNYDEDALPYGEVGSAYKIFDATAHDIYDGDCKVDVAVDYQGSNDTSINVSLNNDNTFIPKYKGLYRITYTASDGNGNVAQKQYFIKVVDENSNPIVITLNQKEVNEKVGETVDLQKVSISGGSGILDKQVKIICLADNSESVMDYSDNMSFQLLKVGQYKVIYTVSDYNNQKKEASYIITALDRADPVYLNEKVVEDALPKFLIAGFSYSLPEMKAHCYSDINKDIDSKITVSQGAIDGLSFTPDISSSEVEITYSATYNNITTTKTFKRPVVNVFKEQNKIDMSKYFVGENVSSSFEKVGSKKYATYKVLNDTKLYYVNALSAEDFSVTLSLNDNNLANFDKISLCLRDSVDSNIVVKANIYIKSSQLYMKVENTSVEYSLGSPYNNNFEFGYSDFARSFTGGTYSSFVAKDSNGKDFNGFTSKMVDFSIEFYGVKGEGTQLMISKIGNQTLTDATKDTMRPVITVIDAPNGNYALDTVLELPKAYAYDLLSPTLKSFNVKVTGPSGTVTSNSNVKLDSVPVDNYSITLNEFGTYKIVYTATDIKGNIATVTLKLTVLDSIPPEINLLGTNKTSVSIDETVKFVDMEYFDNITEKDYLLSMIYVLRPDGGMDKISIKNREYVFNLKGEYKLYYFVQDEAGNYSTIINCINAK